MQVRRGRGRAAAAGTAASTAGSGAHRRPVRHDVATDPGLFGPLLQQPLLGSQARRGPLHDESRRPGKRSFSFASSFR